MSAGTLNTFSQVPPARCAHSLHSLVEQWIELGPHLIFFRAGHMAIAAFLFGSQFGGRRLRFVVIEVVVSPPSGRGVALGILDRDIGAVPRPGEMPSGNTFVFL